MTTQKRIVLTLLFLGLFPAASQAQQSLIFGPQTFERTSMGPNLYEQTFELAEAGDYVLYLRNGDGESSRISMVTVELNGVTVISPQDLSGTMAGLRRPVSLTAGSQQLVVDLGGNPGAFVTIAIARPGEPPIFVHGRLVLPWGRNDSERTLVLALKNGSPQAPRLVRALFFSPSGEPVAVSARISLPPRGSLAASIDTLIHEGAWEVGSIEIFYAGPGVARIFGNARQLSLGSGQSEALALETAGRQVFRGRPDRNEIPSRAQR